MSTNHHESPERTCRADRVRQVVHRLYDLVTTPFTIAAAHHLRAIRNRGIQHFPRARRHLLRVGIFPVRRHFYDPQFHPDDLPASYSHERELPGISFEIERQLQLLASLRWQDELSRFRRRDVGVLDDGTTFDLDNPMFGPGDVDFYYQAIRNLRPRRIVEIGSGHSSIVALAAIEQNSRDDPDYRCLLTAVEPYPWFRHPSLELLEQKVEAVPDEVFTALEDGDILFIDSSHMLRPGGDVAHEYLHLLPLINEGVYIQVHDIFTPFDYPELWVKSWQSFWNEQYVLEAILSGGDDYEVYASLHLLGRNHPEEAAAAMPLLRTSDRHPHSFWIRKTAPAAGRTRAATIANP